MLRVIGSIIIKIPRYQDQCRTDDDDPRKWARVSIMS